MAYEPLHIPPHNLEAERAVLGAILISKRAADKLLATLQEEDFYSPVHKHLFRAMYAVAMNGRTVDGLTLKEELESRGILDKVGGLEYLVELSEAVPVAANAEYYADIVIDRAMLRSLEGAAQDIIKSVHDPSSDVEKKIFDAERAVFEATRRRLGKDFEPVSRLAVEFFREVDRVLEAGEPLHGLGTGLRDLDDLLTGFYPGTLNILAARPGVGKTSLALWYAFHAAKESGQNVAVFSLEMSNLELTRRMVTMLGKVNSNVLKRSGSLRDDQYQSLVDACEQMYPLRLWIDDSSDISVFEMLGKCRRLSAEEGGLGLVIVDYLQLVRSSRIAENRTQQISEIARNLKILAKELNVPVIALSQLSRGIENRVPPIPQLSDLRESGSIEADADTVLMLYRPVPGKGEEAFLHNEDRKVFPIGLFVRKNRNGPIGRICLAFEPEYTLFSDPADDLKRELDDHLRSKGIFE